MALDDRRIDKRLHEHFNLLFDRGQVGADCKVIGRDGLISRRAQWRMSRNNAGRPPIDHKVECEQLK